ncbi:excinuclease ABC subunit A [Weissella ceti]|uniref:Excinuclease ABC subunit A n=1 Tax=Weissella ceti TaxID=759620 RepID=A0ABT3E626_9LACO|nr:excinuclease ABC subunit A [Weissella ceti]MCW0953862.1 excinuclease ABC subunit A [Weissella ceti]QVK12596.1 excinuclease ABC subunit A [Weissella ceti]
MSLPTTDEPRRKLMVIDSKSFYASCECLALGLHPLKTMLVVMSTQDKRTDGLVLASSPLAKTVLGITNVTRRSAVPNHPDLIIVPPRMSYYIAKNKEINDIFREFVAEEDLHMYSVDESILDLTDSWQYLQSKYGSDLTMAKLARIIQLRVRDAVGVYLMVGIGDSPAMAKMALDIGAKKSKTFIGEWSFETIPEYLWPITDFDKVWSIGTKTAEKLQRWGIHSMGDLAHTNPYELRQKFGKVKGDALYALAWGVDRSRIAHKHTPKNKNYSNSQVLPTTYTQTEKIAQVIREMGELLAGRLRSHQHAAQVISLFVTDGRYTSDSSGFSAQMKIPATSQTRQVVAALMTIFNDHYHRTPVRYIGVSADQVIPDIGNQIDLFDGATANIKQTDLDATLDHVRQKFGNTAVFKSSSKLPGSTLLQRANLVAGHEGGES